MTGSSLLSMMEVLNQELQLDSGGSGTSGADQTRALLALNMAQDQFESLLAQTPNVFGSSVGTVNTSASTETTAFPSGVLRIDKLQLIENSLPVYNLERVQNVGGHRWSANWPLYLFQTASTGKPTHYWTNGTNIYWSPLPSGTHTIRYYGFSVASDITEVGTFAYPNIVALPLVSFAVKLLKIGVDDSPTDIHSLSMEVFGPVLATLGNFNRDGAVGLEYTQHHTE